MSNRLVVILYHQIRGYFTYNEPADLIRVAKFVGKGIVVCSVLYGTHEYRTHVKAYKIAHQDIRQLELTRADQSNSEPLGHTLTE